MLLLLLFLFQCNTDIIPLAPVGRDEIVSHRASAWSGKNWPREILYTQIYIGVYVYGDEAKSCSCCSRCWKPIKHARWLTNWISWWHYFIIITIVIRKPASHRNCALVQMMRLSSVQYDIFLAVQQTSISIHSVIRAAWNQAWTWPHEPSQGQLTWKFSKVFLVGINK